MTAVWVLVRARLRARWRALLGLALLVGVASGAVMAAAVGARRTDPAYSRLLEPTRAEDVELEIGGFDNSGFIDSLARLPQVADMGLESVALVTPNMPGDPPKFSTSSPRLQDVMSVDGRVGWTVNRPLILAGRRPDPARPDEVGLSESLARHRRAARRRPWTLDLEPVDRPHRSERRAGDARPQSAGHGPWGHAGGQPGRGLAGSGSGPDPASRRPPQRVRG